MNPGFLLRAALCQTILTLCVFTGGSQDEPKNLPYMNPNLSIETRGDDLVGRMTLEEKISQTLNSAPAIDHLGIPAYDWWNEALHGVARTGTATFSRKRSGLPQCGMTLNCTPSPMQSRTKPGPNTMNRFVKANTVAIKV
jgi:beta-glucosidase-like glycosyl hydrolase